MPILGCLPLGEPSLISTVVDHFRHLSNFDELDSEAPDSNIWQLTEQLSLMLNSIKQDVHGAALKSRESSPPPLDVQDLRTSFPPQPSALDPSGTRQRWDDDGVVHSRAAVSCYPPSVRGRSWDLEAELELAAI